MSAGTPPNTQALRGALLAHRISARDRGRGGRVGRPGVGRDGSRAEPGEAGLSVCVGRHPGGGAQRGRTAREGIRACLAPAGGQVHGGWRGELGAGEVLRELPHHRSLPRRADGVDEGVRQAQRRGPADFVASVPKEVVAVKETEVNGHKHHPGTFYSVWRESRPGRVGPAPHWPNLGAHGSVAARHVRAAIGSGSIREPRGGGDSAHHHRLRAHVAGRPRGVCRARLVGRPPGRRPPGRSRR